MRFNRHASWDFNQSRDWNAVDYSDAERKVVRDALKLAKADGRCGRVPAPDDLDAAWVTFRDTFKREAPQGFSQMKANRGQYAAFKKRLSEKGRKNSQARELRQLHKKYKGLEETLETCTKQTMALLETTIRRETKAAQEEARTTFTQALATAGEHQVTQTTHALEKKADELIFKACEEARTVMQDLVDQTGRENLSIISAADPQRYTNPIFQSIEGEFFVLKNDHLDGLLHYTVQTKATGKTDSGLPCYPVRVSSQHLKIYQDFTFWRENALQKHSKELGPKEIIEAGKCLYSPTLQEYGLAELALKERLDYTNDLETPVCLVDMPRRTAVYVVTDEWIEELDAYARGQRPHPPDSVARSDGSYRATLVERRGYDALYKNLDLSNKNEFRYNTRGSQVHKIADWVTQPNKVKRVAELVQAEAQNRETAMSILQDGSPTKSLRSGICAPSESLKWIDDHDR